MHIAHFLDLYRADMRLISCRWVTYRSIKNISELLAELEERIQCMGGGGDGADTRRSYMVDTYCLTKEKTDDPLSSYFSFLKQLRKPPVAQIYFGSRTERVNYIDCIIGRVTGRSGGGPRVVVSTAAFHARVRGLVPGLGGFKETKMFLPHPRVKVSIVGSLRDREVACSASDRQGSNFESCVWRTVSSQSSHHPQEVLLAQFSLYVHKGGLKPDSFHYW